MRVLFISEKKTETHLFMCCGFCVADLIVKLAKDKFGALQTEYQKVRESVCVCVRLCITLF